MSCHTYYFFKVIFYTFPLTFAYKINMMKDSEYKKNENTMWLIALIVKFGSRFVLSQILQLATAEYLAAASF